MTNISTNLMSALLNNQSIDEFFRSELENAVNELLSNELTAFLDYEKYEYAGRNVNAKYPHAVTYHSPSFIIQIENASVLLCLRLLEILNASILLYFRRLDYESNTYSRR